jgi:hypothetical protein
VVHDVTMNLVMRECRGVAAELDPIPANNTTTVDTLIVLFVDGIESGDLTAWD